LPSGLSSSFGNGATKPVAKLLHLEHYAYRPSEIVDPIRHTMLHQHQRGWWP
jgi:hypothetical protein